MGPQWERLTASLGGSLVAYNFIGGVASLIGNNTENLQKEGKRVLQKDKKGPTRIRNGVAGIRIQSLDHVRL